MAENIGMIEVSAEHFHKVIHPLNVHFIALKEHGEWKLNGHTLIAKTTPGYSNSYVNGILQPKKYFVIPEYAK